MLLWGQIRQQAEGRDSGRGSLGMWGWQLWLLTIGVFQHLIVCRPPREPLQDRGDGQHDVSIPAGAQLCSGVRARQQDKLPHQALQREQHVRTLGDGGTGGSPGGTLENWTFF